MAWVRAKYSNQPDYGGSSMMSIEKRRRFAGGSEFARLAFRKTRQADVCSDGYGVSGFSEHGPRQAEKRAAPGIEPRTSRTRSENHTTRPSSRWRSTASVGVLQAPRPPPATTTTAARTGDQLPTKHRDERSSRTAAAATAVGNMPRPGIEPGTFRSSV